MALESQGHAEPQSVQGSGAPGASHEGSGSSSEVDNKINSIITSRLKDFQKKQEKALADIQAAFSSSLTEQFAKLEGILTKKPDAGASSGGGTGQPPQAADIESSPIVKGLLKKVSQLEAANVEAQKEKERIEAQVRDKTLRENVGSALAGLGIDGYRAKHATGHLVDAAKRIRWSEEDPKQLVFVDDDGDAIDIKTGLTGWANTEEAKLYLPPRGTRGSGDRGGGKTPNGANDQKGKYQSGDFARALLGLDGSPIE